MSADSFSSALLVRLKDSEEEDDFFQKFYYKKEGLASSSAQGTRHIWLGAWGVSPGGQPGVSAWGGQPGGVSTEVQVGESAR